MTSTSYQGQGDREVVRPKAKGSPMSDIAPYQLIVRCFVEPNGNQWQAFSLEFGLAAQADTMMEAKRKLDSMIESYVTDALIGEDREHAYELLNRRATLRVYIRFYFYWSIMHLQKLFRREKNVARAAIYREPLPLGPRHCPI